MSKITRVFVDADACPVKEEIVYIGNQHQVDIYFFASYAHKTNFTGGTWVYVDSLQDEVDFHIFKRAKRGDLVVTQDMGLASLLLSKGVKVISPRGAYLKDEDMDVILYNRYISAKLRRAGTHTKGPKSFTKEHRLQFSDTLQKILSNCEGID